MENPVDLQGLSERYQITAVMADGWEATDRRLDRTVMVHVLPADAPACRRLGLDAVARLDHPAVLGLTDRGPTQAGGQWLVTPHPAGWNLAEIIEHHGSRSESVLRDRLEALLLVAEGVGAAHRRDLVHGAITAHAITVGHHQATLGGWQYAVQIGTDAAAIATGDPQTRSPEQARGVAVDQRSDVHALGAILFRLLIGRAPLLSSDAAEHDRRRRSGELDAPGTDETWLAPTPLLALALASLAADPDDRPADGDAFSDQLRTGLSAARTGAGLAGGFDTRPLPRHHGPGTVLAIVAVLALLAVGLYSLRQQGQLIGFDPAPVVHRFDDPTWMTRWQVTAGNFAVEGERLVHHGSQLGTIVYGQPLRAPVSIAFEAEMLVDHPAGDLSVIWYEQQPSLAQRAYHTPSFMLQTGGYDNQFAGITRNPGGQILSMAPFQLVAGQRYRFEVDIADDVLRLRVDDTLICEHRAFVPFTSGWIGLMAYYPGKAFGPVRIATTKPRPHVSALAVGDALFRRELWTAAAEEYATIAESHAQRELGITARYRQGLALYRGARHNDADKAWESLPEGTWKQIARCLMLQRWSLTGSHQTVASGLATLAATSDPLVRQAVRDQWLIAARQLPGRGADDLIDVFLAVVDAHFANDPLAAAGSAQLCLRAGRFGEAVRRSAGVRRTHVESLMAAGLPEVLLDTYPNDVQGSARALLQLGRFSEIPERFPQVEWAVREAALIAGTPVNKLPTHLEVSVRIADGEAEALLAADPPPSHDAQRALLLALDRRAEARAAGANDSILDLLDGKSEEVLHEGKLNDRSWLITAWYVWLDRVIAAGTDTETDTNTATNSDADAWLARIISVQADHRYGELWFLRDVLSPLAQGGLSGLTTHAQSVASKAPTTQADGQRAWHFHAYLSGHIDRAAFLAQPAGRQATSLVYLADGLRAEIADDHAAAFSAYTAFLALAPWQRPTDDGTRQVILERFAQWRHAVLAAQPAAAVEAQ